METGPWGDFLQLLFSDQFGPMYGRDFKFENELKTARFIHGPDFRRNLLIGWMNFLPKVSLEVEGLSNEYREKGNAKFKKNDNRSVAEAVLLYTKAICTAPSKSRALALAHGNRAAALFKLGEFEAAYNDSQCALNLNHPKTHLMILRQATCARSMSDAAIFEACLQKIEELQVDVKFPEVEEFRKDLDNMKKNVASDSTTSNENRITEKKQKILRSKRYGRYVVADEPIDCDDVIMTEEPFAFVPLFEEVDFLFNMNNKTLRYVCDNCAEDNIVLFPCNACQNVFYCTPRCREQHIPIHSIECNGYKIHLFLQVGPFAHLALRSLLAVFDSLLEKVKNQRTSNARPLTSAEQLWRRILDTARDGELMGLCTNYDAPANIPCYAQTSSLLCCYLSCETLFFENTRRKRLAIMRSESEWEIIVTALLLRLISQMLCNAFNISGITVKENFFGITFPPGRMFESVAIRTPFLAVYPRTSLYNHSCDSNLRVEFVKSKIYVIATKDIGTEKQIFNYYTVCKRCAPRDERRALLKKRYGFTCNCVECREDGDVSYFRYNHVICNGNGCNQSYVPDENTGNKCPVCGKKYDEVLYENFVGGILIGEESIETYEYLLEVYIELSRYLPLRTNLRSRAGILILAKFMHCDSRSITSNETISRRLLNIAIDISETVEHNEGVGFDFLYYSAFALDIIALRKINGLERIDTGSFLMKIKRAINQLAPGIRRKFENYIDAYAN